MNKKFAHFLKICDLSLRLQSGSRSITQLVTVLIMLAVVAGPVFAQSGDISGSTGQFTTLGTVILQVVTGLATFAFVGLIIGGGLTLATNRPRGLAMIGGGLCGALLAGLAFALVSTLTGHSVSSSL